MALTLTPEELTFIKTSVETIFLEYEDITTRRNKLGYKGDMHEGNELAMYTYLLRDVSFPNFQDDTYVSILSNTDIYRMHNRSLQILNTVR